jgi:hypothetical protein
LLKLSISKSCMLPQMCPIFLCSQQHQHRKRVPTLNEISNRYLQESTCISLRARVPCSAMGWTGAATCSARSWCSTEAQAWPGFSHLHSQSLLQRLIARILHAPHGLLLPGFWLGLVSGYLMAPTLKNSWMAC